MPRAPEIMTIDVPTGMPGWTEIKFAHKRSTLDFEVVIWNPNKVLPAADRAIYEGHPYLQEDEPRVMRQQLERRAHEISSFLNSGGDLVVFAQPEEGFWLGNNNFVSGWHLNAWPEDWKDSNGTRVTVADSGPLGQFLRARKADIQYRSTFSPRKWDGWVELAKTERTSESIAAVQLRDEGGRIVLLPYMGDQAGNAQFWSELVNALIASRSAGEDAPAWASDYTGMREKEIRDEAAVQAAALRAAETELARLVQSAEDASRAKPLLYAQGAELENAVLFVLSEMGGVPVPTEENRVDHVLSFEDWVAVIEVKGLKGSAKEENAAQLEKWMTDWTGHDDVKPILIVNAYREVAPLERQDPFPHQMLKYATRRDHALISSLQLYAIYEEFQLDPLRREALLAEMRATVGLMKGHSITPFFRG